MIGSVLGGLLRNMAPDSWFPGDPFTFDSVVKENIEAQPKLVQKKMREAKFGINEQSSEEDKRSVKPWGKYRRKAYVSVDIGKKTDFTAVSIIEPYEPLKQRDDGRDVYDVSFIQRIPLDTPYPKVAKGLARLDKKLRKTKEFEYIYWIFDSGGVGESVTDMVVDLLPNSDIYRCYLTGGQYPNFNFETNSVSLPKTQMASTLIMLFESDRIEISGGADDYFEELEALRDELYNFELRISPNKVDQWGAFKYSKHDDLAVSLGMGGWLAEFMEGRGTVEIW